MTAQRIEEMVALKRQVPVYQEPCISISGSELTVSDTHEKASYVECPEVGELSDIWPLATCLRRGYSAHVRRGVSGVGQGGGVAPRGRGSAEGKSGARRRGGDERREGASTFPGRGALLWQP